MRPRIERNLENWLTKSGEIDVSLFSVHVRGALNATDWSPNAFTCLRRSCVAPIKLYALRHTSQNIYRISRRVLHVLLRWCGQAVTRGDIQTPTTRLASSPIQWLRDHPDPKKTPRYVELFTVRGSSSWKRTRENDDHDPEASHRQPPPQPIPMILSLLCQNFRPQRLKHYSYILLWLRIPLHWYKPLVGCFLVHCSDIARISTDRRITHGFLTVLPNILWSIDFIYFFINLPAFTALSIDRSEPRKL